MSSAIQTADLDWQCVDGIDIPVSKQFGQAYFSSAHALLEAQHVFLNGNDLTTRLTKLADFEYFCIGETAFGYRAKCFNFMANVAATTPE